MHADTIGTLRTAYSSAGVTVSNANVWNGVYLYI